MKNIVYFFSLVLLCSLAFSCEVEPEELAQPKEEAVDFEWTKPFIVDLDIPFEFDPYFEVGYENPSELKEFFKEISAEMFEEIDADVDFTTTLTIGKHRTRVDVETESTDFELKKNKWARVGEVPCRNEECVAGRTATAYENHPGADLKIGDCLQVRHRRVRLGVIVEYYHGPCD